MNAPAVSAEEKRVKLAESLRRASRREARGPLSFAQQRLWFLDQLDPNSPLYNVPSVTRLAGALNVAALEKALRRIIDRHEPLRTRFACPGETPVQVVSTQAEFEFRLIAVGSANEAEEWIRAEVRRPFNLMGSEALLRASLVRLQADVHLLVLNLHHIAADEWSLSILYRELEELYQAQVENRQPRLPELPVPYSEYAA